MKKQVSYGVYYVILTFVLALIILLLLALLKNTSDNDATQAEADEGLAATMTELGVPLRELKADMTQFVLDTYMPVESATKEDYLTSITEYLSESEYTRLLNDLGNYSADIETSVRDLEVSYGLAENNTDNCDMVLCSFYLNKSASGVTVRNKINLIFMIQGGEITQHTVYTGRTEKQVA